MRILPFLCLLVFSHATIYAKPFKSIFDQGNAGDYSIYQNSSHVTILSISKKTNEVLTLQEITLPRTIYNNIKGKDLHSWINQNAPGHTSWTIMEIDQKNLNVLSTYCVTRKIHLSLMKQDTIIASLLGLNVEKTEKNKLLRIGPRGLNKTDSRPLWVPAMKVDGKGVTAKKVDVYSSSWPKDDSFLSGRMINLYILDDFAFPYWIAIHGSFGSKKMLSIDSGKNLPIPMIKAPIPPPEFASKLESWNDKENYSFLLKSHGGFKQYSVYLIEISKENNKLIPVDSNYEKLETNILKFNVYKKTLESKLVSGKKYRIYLSYTDEDEIKSIISKNIIHWK